MPIGKNSIKRAANNGYSKVTTSAPDMENSVVVEVKKEEPKKSSPKKTTPPKKAEPKKAEPKKTAPKKSMETEPDFSPVKTAEKVTKKSTKKSQRKGECYINIGGELPIHLL